jgi:cation transport regulator
MLPYNTNADLPARVRNVLPVHAQDIFRTAFNNAWEEYADPAKRRRGGNLEEVANRVAWSAVKMKYEKADGHWTSKA